MLILGNTINGYKKGFAKKLVRVINIFISIIGWPILYPVIKYSIKITGILSHLDSVNKIILEAIKNTIGNETINGTYIMMNVEAKTIQALSNLEIKVISFFVTMLLIYFILTFGVKCSNIVSKIKFTEKIDHILGGCIALAECMIIIWGVLAIIYVFSTIANLTVWIDKLDSIVLLHYMYRFNPLIFLLK